jgi:hypothetical protein
MAVSASELDTKPAEDGSEPPVSEKAMQVDEVVEGILLRGGMQLSLPPHGHRLRPRRSGWRWASLPPSWTPRRPKEEACIECGSKSRRYDSADAQAGWS